MGVGACVYERERKAERERERCKSISYLACPKGHNHAGRAGDRHWVEMTSFNDTANTHNRSWLFRQSDLWGRILCRVKQYREAQEREATFWLLEREQDNYVS